MWNRERGNLTRRMWNPHTPKAPYVTPRPRYENQPITKWKDVMVYLRSNQRWHPKERHLLQKPYTKTATTAIAISINNNSRKENNQEMWWRRCRLLLLLSLRCEHPYCKIDKNPKHHPSKQSKSMCEPPNLFLHQKKKTHLFNHGNQDTTDTITTITTLNITFLKLTRPFTKKTPQN